ncbi:unnamed protein product [Prunus brigantina]
MSPTLFHMAQIFGFMPYGRPADAVGDYHRRKNGEKVTKKFTISSTVITKNCSFSNFLKRFTSQLSSGWRRKFAGLSNASTAVMVLFANWNVGTIQVEPDAKKFIMQMLQGINAQVIEDPSMASNLSGQAVQTRQVIVISIIAARDLEVDLGE